MRNYLILLMIFSCVACFNTSDLSKYTLSADERRDWPSFESNNLELGFQYPKKYLAKDSEDLVGTVHVLDPRGNGRFNMLIKIFDGPDKNLQEVGDQMVNGASFKFNYRLGSAGIINFDGKEAYQHEYTTSNVFGNAKRHYQLIYPINGVRHLVTLESDQREFFSCKKDLFKILRSLKSY